MNFCKNHQVREYIYKDKSHFTSASESCLWNVMYNSCFFLRILIKLIKNPKFLHVVILITTKEIMQNAVTCGCMPAFYFCEPSFEGIFYIAFFV
jgi:hypothetical protein